MQNKYAGDIGDYVKFAILRTLSPERRVGVAWWLFPDSGPAGDGRHISYLKTPQIPAAQRADWYARGVGGAAAREINKIPAARAAGISGGHLDPALFDALRQMVESGRRGVAALEDASLLPGTVYFSEVIPCSATPAKTRALRAEWFARCRALLKDCDLVFLDPDNGFETKNFSLGARNAGKSVSLEALTAMRQRGRTLIVYHHHTHLSGGHVAELGRWADCLRALDFERVDALRASPYSPRAFFLLDADDKMRAAAAALAKQWLGLISWHANPTLL